MSKDRELDRHIIYWSGVVPSEEWEEMQSMSVHARCRGKLPPNMCRWCMFKLRVLMWFWSWGEPS